MELIFLDVEVPQRSSFFLDVEVPRTRIVPFHPKTPQLLPPNPHLDEGSHSLPDRDRQRHLYEGPVGFTEGRGGDLLSRPWGVVGDTLS